MYINQLPYGKLCKNNKNRLFDILNNTRLPKEKELYDVVNKMLTGIIAFHNDPTNK